MPNRKLELWALLSALSLSITSQGRAAEVQLAAVRTVGHVEHFALNESSGLVASPRFPGILWTHNDTESPPFLFAMASDGRHVGAFEVQGARLIDWEALAYSDGSLYLADTGSDGMERSHSAVHRIEEPNPFDRWGPAKVRETWYIRFPGDRIDCEGFFVVEGFGYLLGKTPIDGMVPLYRFPLQDQSTSLLLELAARVPVPAPVSDVTLSLDGNRLGLITSAGVLVTFIGGDPLAASYAYRQFSAFANDLAEGGAFLPEGVLTVSEVTGQIHLFSDPLLAGAPFFDSIPKSQTAFTGDTVRFEASALGFPAPSYQWFFNDSPLPGETNAILNLSNLTLVQAGDYDLITENAIGKARAGAVLSVLQRRVNLRVTEVMSNQAANAIPVADWWELTSFESEPVHLGGWRFNESTGGLEDAFVIPPGISIQPQESIIFVEDLTDTEFRNWWGAANLPERLQIVTFAGSQLSFNSLGDSVRIWDNAATNDTDVMVQVEFGAAKTGRTFGYDPLTDDFGISSEPGINGAFRATVGDDVGSPGILVRETGPILRASRQSEFFHLRVHDHGNAEYLLEQSIDLRDWIPVEEPPSAMDANLWTLPIEEGKASIFYRLTRRVSYRAPVNATLFYSKASR